MTLEISCINYFIHSHRWSIEVALPLPILIHLFLHFMSIVTPFSSHFFSRILAITSMAFPTFSLFLALIILASPSAASGKGTGSSGAGAVQGPISAVGGEKPFAKAQFFKDASCSQAFSPDRFISPSLSPDGKCLPIVLSSAQTQLGFSKSAKVPVCNVDQDTTNCVCTFYAGEQCDKKQFFGSSWDGAGLSAASIPCVDLPRNAKTFQSYFCKGFDKCEDVEQIEFKYEVKGLSVQKNAHLAPFNAWDFDSWADEAAAAWAKATPGGAAVTETVTNDEGDHIGTVKVTIKSPGKPTDPSKEVIEALLTSCYGATLVQGLDATHAVLPIWLRENAEQSKQVGEIQITTGTSLQVAAGASGEGAQQPVQGSLGEGSSGGTLEQKESKTSRRKHRKRSPSEL